ncbi:MAG: CotH kinase family protein [Erysipelotrichaceae bacterium]|nr:CotH kinase family protein [Erysipelotrichaceae bacterium]
MRRSKAFFILLLSFLLCSCSMPIDSQDTESLSYEELLFDTSYVHKINVEISDEDWNDLLENPKDKTKYHVNVTVDGQRYEDVSFATKGNISLDAIAKKENQIRYSFKINFTKFNKDSDYHGLNKLHLNNGYCDATYMKDYLSYRVLAEAGVKTPLCSYVWLTINGKDFGLYQAIEEVGKSWLKRNDLGDGALYKPEYEDSYRGFHSSSLVYTDDEIGSYPEIFNNNETPVDDQDKHRLIGILKAMNERNDLEEYLDTEEIIRYFVGHNYVGNYDSYTGNMLHNYYLYEKDGKLSVYPWDYNLAFGGFQTGKTIDYVNIGIDTPLRNLKDEEQRPLWTWIAQDDEYLQRYHEIFDELLRSYFESGRCEEEIDTISRMIRSYVEKDPTAFFDVERFDKAIATLKIYCSKRTQSIRKQLNNGLSTVTELQEDADKIPVNDLVISLMGQYGSRFFNR